MRGFHYHSLRPLSRSLSNYLTAETTPVFKYSKQIFQKTVIDGVEIIEITKNKRRPNTPRMLMRRYPFVVFSLGPRDKPSCALCYSVIKLLESYGYEFDVVNVLDYPDCFIPIANANNPNTRDRKFMYQMPMVHVNEKKLGDGNKVLEYHITGNLKDIIDTYLKEKVFHSFAEYISWKNSKENESPEAMQKENEQVV